MISKEYLLEEYVKNKRTLQNIADDCKCYFTLIYYYLKKYNIKIRSRGWESKRKIHIDKQFLIDKYLNKNISINKISRELKCDKTTIAARMDEYNIPRNKNIRKGKNNGRYIDGRSLKIYHCEVCGKKISHYSSKICRICFGKRERGSKNIFYIDGRCKLKYPRKFNTRLKTKILKRDKYTCQLCGISESGSIEKYLRKLAIHHIDYNKKNCKKDNLISLCVSCHAKTNLNRKYWIKKFTYAKAINF